MSRRMRCAAVPALLILLTSGAVQARPLHVQAPPASLWAQIWQLAIWQWTGIWTKEGEGMDPNGVTPQSSVVAPWGTGSHPNRGPIGR